MKSKTILKLALLIVIFSLLYAILEWVMFTHVLWPHSYRLTMFAIFLYVAVLIYLAVFNRLTTTSPLIILIILVSMLCLEDVLEIAIHHHKLAFWGYKWFLDTLNWLVRQIVKVM